MAPSISITTWYAIGGGFLLASVLLFRIGQSYRPILQFWLQRHLSYPLLIYDVTRLQALLLVTYVSINVLLLTLFLDNGVALGERAALLAALNMVTVFLGGRTNPLIDMANVSLRTYYFWHFWAGRVIAIQGLLHAGIQIAGQVRRSDSLAVSGWIISILFLLLLVGSLPFFRRRVYAGFIKVHFILVLGTLAGLIWHVLTRSLYSKAPVFIAAVVWATSATYRFLLYLRWRDASVTDARFASNGTHVQVQLAKPLRPYPGMYFYLYFSGLPIRYKFYGFPMTAFFWHLSKGEAFTRDLHFLVQKRESLARLHMGSQLPKVSIEGPYGKNLRAETYETVILVAEGIGIAGVLPHALHIAQRRQHDQRFKATNTQLYRDVTRKVDLLWKLDDNQEENWCTDELLELMSMDTKKTLLSGRLFYPSKKQQQRFQIPKDLTKFWKCYFEDSDKKTDDHIQHYIKWNSYSPGRCIAIVCGSQAFCRRAREFIVTTPRLAVDFAEPEFIPTPQETKATVKLPEVVGNRGTRFRKTRPNLTQPTHKPNRNIQIIETQNWI